MSFLDKAKAAANDLASKADTALSGAGLGVPGASEADRYFKELGRLAYDEAVGRPHAPGEREHLVGLLRDLESKGAVHQQAGPAAPPPPPGAGHAPGQAPAAPEGFTAPPPPPPTSAPPPPSWAQGGQS